MTDPRTPTPCPLCAQRAADLADLVVRALTSGTSLGALAKWLRRDRTSVRNLALAAGVRWWRGRWYPLAEIERRVADLRAAQHRLEAHARDRERRRALREGRGLDPAAWADAHRERVEAHARRLAAGREAAS